MKTNLLSKPFRFRLVSFATIFVLLDFIGCSTSLKQRNETDYVSSGAVARARVADIAESVRMAEVQRVSRQDVNKPYLAGNSIPLSREVMMPDNLRKSIPITAMFANVPIDFQTALNQLSASANITITATPDALLPASVYGVKASATGGATAITAPPKLQVHANGTPLWQVLDDAAAQTQTFWRPTPNGAEFYRVETKTYELMTIAQTYTTSAALGRTGSAANAFNSDSKTAFETKTMSQIDGLKISVDALLSNGGRFSISPESQTLIVTDTPVAQKRVAEFIKSQNKLMSRRIRLLVEAIEVTNKEDSEFGIDWNLAYNTAQNAVTGASQPTLTSAQTGQINFQQMLGPLAGSGLVVQALNEVGVVTNRRIFPLLTTNGRPVTQAIRSTFNYVDQVQTTSSAGNSSNTNVVAPTVTQKDETVGTFLTLVPTSKTDGTILLSVSYDVTSAEPLRPFTVGSGAAAVTVQQKTINGSGVIQEVPIRPGRPEVIGGLELSTTQNTQRRLGDGLPILAGGSNISALNKSVTILLVTATVEEGI